MRARARLSSWARRLGVDRVIKDYGKKKKIPKKRSLFRVFRARNYHPRTRSDERVIRRGWRHRTRIGAVKRGIECCWTWCEFEGERASETERVRERVDVWPSGYTRKKGVWSVARGGYPNSSERVRRFFRLLLGAAGKR